MRADAREEEARGLGCRERAARGVLEFSCSSLIGSRVVAVVVDHRAARALLVSRERLLFFFGIFWICEHGKALNSEAGREVPLSHVHGIPAPGTKDGSPRAALRLGVFPPSFPLVIVKKERNDREAGEKEERGASLYVRCVGCEIRRFIGVGS